GLPAAVLRMFDGRHLTVGRPAEPHHLRHDALAIGIDQGQRGRARIVAHDAHHAQRLVAVGLLRQRVERGGLAVATGAIGRYFCLWRGPLLGHTGELDARRAADDGDARDALEQRAPRRAAPELEVADADVLDPHHRLALGTTGAGLHVFAERVQHHRLALWVAAEVQHDVPRKSEQYQAALRRCVEQEAALRLRHGLDVEPEGAGLPLPGAVARQLQVERAEHVLE